MSLAKERVAQDTHISNMYGIQALDPSFESYGYESYHKMLLQEEREISPRGCNLTSLSSLNDADGSDLKFTSFSSSSSEEAHSLVDFKTRSDEWAYTNGTLLSFEQGERISHPTSYSKMGDEAEYMSWVDAIDHKIECDYLNSKCAVSSRLLENLNSYETACSNGSMKGTDKDNRCGDERCGWLYPAGDGLQDSGLSQGCFNKRPHMGGDVQTSKKHCPGEARKPKTKPIAYKDPQSIAAKHRRERISERLKILQDLVPNGSKVDLVTMLEKAISYVKFLQLQVKVLATDEFWPAQGGKAPEAAQVKEAIDSILSSHRNRDSISK
ncbi:hypothetical protein MRB53_024451 [Persea americana]|uniref:Uncharacterized protein n=1 Tax=Persea americana TaxID=3435 RepID=A0ACC2LD85_PERAE|nr:hypothetical protein MRB53_024451 [Persea americana]